MKALITGIAGQDGSYLAKLLNERGYDVIGIARKSERMPNMEYLGASARMYYGDVSEHDFINHVIKTEKPDEIYNLAAQSHVGLSFKNPVTTMQVNYGGLVNIISAVKEHSNRSKIYQAGTSEMFGASVVADDFDEMVPFKPKSPYAISKVAAHWAGVNARNEGIWVSNGILFNHESPLRGEDFVTRKITIGVSRIAKGLSDHISLGNTSSKRDWGFAGDYVDGMWRMLQNHNPDDFVLATGTVHSVQDFVNAAFKAVGLKPEGRVLSNCDDCIRPNDLNYLKGDYRKARDFLGWKPQVGFDELVSMMVERDMK